MTNGTLLLGRILMSAIFILAGVAKIGAPAATQSMMAKYGLPMPMLAYLVTVVVEFGGGLALLLGVATRPVAVLLGLWCIATGLVAHTHFGDPNMRAHFMKNVAMAGGFAYVWAFGAGAYSLDAWLNRRSARAGHTGHVGR
jgi:putative oxidoreductase